MSLAEIAIIVAKFWVFLTSPDWTIWTMSWFVNKLFVLACFTMLLPVAAAAWRGGYAGSAASRAS